MCQELSPIGDSRLVKGVVAYPRTERWPESNFTRTYWERTLPMA